MNISFVAREKGELNLSLIYLAIFVGCALYLYILNMFNSLLILPCVFKKITGFPCPTCGSTRLLQNLLHLKPLLAFLNNPLVFLLGIAFLIWVAYGFFSHFSKKKVKIALTPSESRFLRWGVLILLILNWIYLILAGI